MVTAADVDEAVQLALETLSAAKDADWDDRAGTLEWTCWETVEHLADDLFSYAARFGPRIPPTESEVAFDFVARRPGGPRSTIFADRSAGVPGLFQVLEACGAFLVRMVSVAPADAVAYHVYGASTPDGFAAMGVVETLVHTHDIAEGLGLEFHPPAALCDRSLKRLFPDAPEETNRWQTLLWATGRGDLPGRERLTSWRWRG
ncbi:hypothetical protein FKR81_11760 [Lentzea tibetensis]|uniref:Mycothiol-dependent maleylpyruvate isomerase metal-binding domain-containing protein n=1 Tax=Lentzea tibetensis TaxID=2591470 RepID=A0A563EX42_9PSEU|nr:maleylpyruvate isomerase N-terminal domain-containing protein [Lentzea tibetensis]TWP52239.1 hypothetical protein FKR81_11760 [Lentzea tibetensis]